MGALVNLKVTLVSSIIIVSIYPVYGDFTAQCPQPCECKWFSGNKAASCTDASLTSIPDKLSSDIQNLNLSSNPLYEITQNAFENVGLVNLKKLVLRNCLIETIHKDGFKNLRIMIEIDVSRNQITTLHPDTFTSNERVRVIHLSNNKIEELKDGLFKDLKFLQNIELSNNRIFKIETKTFVNLPVLKRLALDSNNLTHIKLEALSKLPTLSSLELQNNLWKCDCNLQTFRNWVIDHNLYTHPTSCAEPTRLHNRNWNELDSSDFACKPIIIEPLQGTSVQATNENITLSCKVTGNPKPDVTWSQNTIVLDGLSRRHGDNRLIIRRNDVDLTVWVNLTISNVRYQDRADYTCVAKNPGGSDSRTISLIVNRIQGSAGSGVSANESLVLIAGLSVGALILVILIVLLCYCFCRKKDIKRHMKSDMHSSNGEALIEGSVIPEMEKSLITTVNPLIKPPRRYDAPMSNSGGGTEMSELNKTLLDSDSIFAPNEDETRSINFTDQHPKRSRDMLSVSTSGHGDQRTYPPDLLSFPPRGGQASPAASSASTAPDSTRLPPQIQQSPIHSPIYGTNPNLFKTLSHSRSQSPFTSPCAPTAATRVGYVTIPRRPRIPSWASTASYMTVVAPTEGVEPVYDNLGLRTTADGSSVLSLNKAGLEQQLSPNSMRNRPLPSTPGNFQGAVPVMYAPIEEQEQAPSPAPGTPYSSTLPRIGSNSMHFQLSPSLHDLEQRTNRLKENSETGPAKKYTSAEKPQPSPFLTNGSTFDPSNNESVYDIPSSRSGKIPPRPPPKPKKKSPSDPNGPLFEDEGEDGTEV